jgi:leucyl aminopeptidase
VTIEVLDVPAMEKLGMGSILAVGQGSARPPRLFVARYAGGPNGEAPIAFVGKGITFDTGGISLKPGDNMWRMKYDMTGAASSVGALLALARRGAKVNAIAVAALAENMPSGTASRPGDVVRTASGQTYEIMSTDAEGRMVLVDALWFVQTRDQPRVIIDIATLTGSQVTALGDEYAGLFSRDEALAAQLIAAGAASGEEVWRLPLHPSYAKDLESPIADLRNGGSSGKAGAGVGAFFIGAWVQPGVAWAHLDIASMAWRDDLPLPTVPLGASGYGVRLFDRFVREHVERAGR